MAKKEIILVQEPEWIHWALCAVYTPNPHEKGIWTSQMWMKRAISTNQSKENYFNVHFTQCLKYPPLLGQKLVHLVPKMTIKSLL